MAILGIQNPVILAGFDILIFGKRGFSSLARAKRVKVRTKGSSDPWIELKFTKRHKLKVDKENALFRLLQKLSYARDLKRKKEKPKKVVKKKAAPVRQKHVDYTPPPTREEQEEIVKRREPKLRSKIKFKPPTMIEKGIKTRAGKQIYIKKYDFALARDIQFATGSRYEASIANEFIQAVKEEFKKLYKIHGARSYLVRINHEYKNFVNYYDAYPNEKPDLKDGTEPEDKGFGGYSLNRQPFENQSVIDDQFDFALTTKYLSSFSRYLNFANPSTEFNFSGFTVEVTTSTVEKKPRVTRKKVITGVTVIEKKKSKKKSKK